MLRAARFLRGYLRHPANGTGESEATVEVGGAAVPASVIRPRNARSYPGWVVLHGITVPGRHHPALRRFAHALAATGAVVIIPEVPAWRRLLLDPDTGDRTVAAAAAHLRSRPDVTGDPLKLVGFSFGGTQALISAAKPGIGAEFGEIVAFGAYCDLGRTLLYMMTGEHEWAGLRSRADPDPYGRWIVVANYLAGVPEYAHMGELASAAYALAVETGRRGVYAADPRYDGLKAEHRERLPQEQRELWDLIAPPSGVRPPAEPGRELARKLLAAATARHPQLDPLPLLPRLAQTLVLAHGHGDRLIPFTETLRLHSHLSPDTRAGVWVTRLFAHSSEAGPLPYHRYPGEFGRYLALLNRALRPC
jgi:hypothetical protein